VGGDAQVRPSSAGLRVQELLNDVDEVRVDIGLVGEGAVGRFLIGALAQADECAIGGQGLHIGFTAIQIGLDHDADVVIAMLMAQLAVYAERDVGIIAALHVDRDVVAGGFGFIQDGPHVFHAQVFANVQP